MKKGYKTILRVLGFIFIIGFVIYFLIITSNKATAPERLPNIPKSATWKGGVDEGFWFDIVNIDSTKKTYRFKIYNDYKGDLVMDADFVKDSSCTNEYPLNYSIIEKINLFEFNKIVMTDNCKLYMIKPAYGGIFLELDKETNK